MWAFKRTLLATLVAGVLLAWAVPALSQKPQLSWGSTGSDVRLVQTKLRDWGYYFGPVDGIFGSQTSQAVQYFQRENGLVADGIVGPATWAALGYWGGPTGARAQPVAASQRADDLDLLARAVTAEAGAEPYEGQVAVAAVILNRVESPAFPNTIAGVIYQPGAFEAVDNGWIYKPATATAYRAASDALNGWDPTDGALYYWNPDKSTSKWIWSRTIHLRIGNHVFAR